MGAQRPLVITGYLGRNHNTPPLLEELCDKLPINVVEMVGSDVCIRSTHEAYLGVTVSTHPAVSEADVILILDCDVPWIPTAGEPKKGKNFPHSAGWICADIVDTKIFHLDVDPLKQQMPRMLYPPRFSVDTNDIQSLTVFSIRAIRRLKVSGELALKQLNSFIDNQGLDVKQYDALFQARRTRYNSWRANLKSLESPPHDNTITVPYLASRLRDQLPQDTTFVMEAVTNAGHLIHHLNLTKVA